MKTWGNITDDVADNTKVQYKSAESRHVIDNV